MQEALEIISQYKEVGETEDLILDDCKFEHFTAELKHQIEQLPDLLYLSLNNCGLKSLNHFPTLKNVVTLELIDNEFPIRELSHLKGLVALKVLEINGNHLEKIEQLESLKELKHLERLELNECDFADEEQNKKKIFEFLPQLKVLNGEDKDGNAVEFSDEDSEDYSDEEEDEEGEDDEDDEDDEDNDDEDDDEEDDEDEEDDDEEEA